MTELYDTAADEVASIKSALLHALLVLCGARPTAATLRALAASCEGESAPRVTVGEEALKLAIAVEKLSDLGAEAAAAAGAAERAQHGRAAARSCVAPLLLLAAQMLAPARPALTGELISAAAGDAIEQLLVDRPDAFLHHEFFARQALRGRLDEALATRLSSPHFNGPAGDAVDEGTWSAAKLIMHRGGYANKRHFDEGGMLKGTPTVLPRGSPFQAGTSPQEVTAVIFSPPPLSEEDARALESALCDDFARIGTWSAW